MNSVPAYLSYLFGLIPKTKNNRNETSSSSASAPQRLTASPFQTGHKADRSRDSISQKTRWQGLANYRQRGSMKPFTSIRSTIMLQLVLLSCFLFLSCEGQGRGRGRGQPSKDPTIAMLMMCRDEEANLRANLPLWTNYVDYYVFGIDNATTDSTVQAINEILPRSSPRHIYNFTFDGFGQARTLLFQAAWSQFPQASHLLLADPDWLPEVHTINRQDLDYAHDYFQFRIWDRNNYTTRQSDWLMQHREGIYMIHRLHEMLVYPKEETITKELSWEVYEVETHSSWHVKMGHQHSQSYKRYLFDLSLLEKDLVDEGDDPSDHTLYYLGITTFALMEAGSSLINAGLLPQNESEQFIHDIQRRTEEGLYYLNLRIERHVNSRNWEQTWAAMRWLAYSYQLLKGEFDKAKFWYQKCSSFDPERVDCPIFLARLYLEYNLLADAWEECVTALTTRYPLRAFGNNFYIYDCFTPIQAAKVLQAQLQEGGSGYDPTYFTLGWHLVDYATQKCDRGVLLEAPDSIDVLRGEFAAIAYANGLTPEGAASCWPSSSNGGIEHQILRQRLGYKLPLCGSSSSSSKEEQQQPSTSNKSTTKPKKTFTSAGYSVGPAAWHNDEKEKGDKVEEKSCESSATFTKESSSSAPINASLSEAAAGSSLSILYQLLHGHDKGGGLHVPAKQPPPPLILVADKDESYFHSYHQQSTTVKTPPPPQPPATTDPVVPPPQPSVPPAIASNSPAAAAPATGGSTSPSSIIDLDVLSYYLYRGKKDWSGHSPPFRVMLLGDENLNEIGHLLHQLEKRGIPSYEVVYAHQDSSFLEQASKQYASYLANNKNKLQLRHLHPPHPSTNKPLFDRQSWGTFDYIAVSHILNISPYEPLALLTDLRSVLTDIGGMTISSFANNSLLEAVQHLRALLLANVGKRKESIQAILARFAEKAMIDQEVAEGDKAVVMPDKGLYQAAPRILRAFEVSELYEIVEKAGFAVVDCLGAIFYEPLNYIEDPVLLDSLEMLSSPSRYSVGEHFVPRSRHVLFAVKQEALRMKPDVVGEMDIPPSSSKRLLYHAIPVLLASSSRYLQDVLASSFSHSNATTVLEHQIPFSTELYTWKLSPLCKEILRRVDGRRSVVAIYEEIMMMEDPRPISSSSSPSSQRLADYITEFQSLWTVLKGLNLMVLKDPTRPRKRLQRPSTAK